MAAPKDPDYTLNIFHHEDEEKKTSSVVLVVQTTKVFVSFQYDILLQVAQEDRTIRLKIQGLHAPELLMPGSGPARGHVELTSLSGHYKVQVTKQDKSMNEFDVEVGKKSVMLLHSPQHPFIAASTEKVEF